MNKLLRKHCEIECQFIFSIKLLVFRRHERQVNNAFSILKIKRNFYQFMSYQRIQCRLGDQPTISLRTINIKVIACTPAPHQNNLGNNKTVFNSLDYVPQILQYTYLHQNATILLPIQSVNSHCQSRHTSTRKSGGKLCEIFVAIDASA